jgi:hypothetical protein
VTHRDARGRFVKARPHAIGKHWFEVQPEPVSRAPVPAVPPLTLGPGRPPRGRAWPWLLILGAILLLIGLSLYMASN